MSITTKTGDDGTTSLLFGERVSKDSLRIECLGCVDELDSALGFARAVADDRVKEIIFGIQKELIPVMGLLAQAAPPDDTAVRYGFDTARLETLAAGLERDIPPLKAFAIPGDDLPSAALHQARTLCRRVERRLVSLQRAEGLDAELLRYMNRLSDLLFLLARFSSGGGHK